MLFRLRNFTILLAVLVVVSLVWITPFQLEWKDRRPIGALHLASYAHRSTTNPRGWFNDPELDVTGPGGTERFRAKLMTYADRAIAIMKAVDAQGTIVWDLEGEEYPHKITYLGDPRVLRLVAPECEAAADEFFARFRAAGLRVGVTVRPQRLDLPASPPRQRELLNMGAELRAKIDYARSRWGATLFYVDSTWGPLRPDEVAQLRELAKTRPDVLLIPEHAWLPYQAFSAPYASLEHGGSPLPSWVRSLYPRAFRVVNISDRASRARDIASAQAAGDVLMFSAWFETPEFELVKRLRR